MPFSYRQDGQNKVWLAGNVIYKALFEKDKDELESARNVIVSEIYLTMGKEYNLIIHIICMVLSFSLETMVLLMP